MSRQDGQRGLSMERLLMEIVQGMGHIHQMLHDIRRKTDFLIEMAANGPGGDSPEVAAAIEKLKASSDSLENAVKTVGDATKEPPKGV